MGSPPPAVASFHCTTTARHSLGLVRRGLCRGLGPCLGVRRRQLRRQALPLRAARVGHALDPGLRLGARVREAEGRVAVRVAVRDAGVAGQQDADDLGMCVSRGRVGGGGRE